MTDTKQIKTLTINGTKYKLKGSIEVLKCGDISISADNNGMANVSQLFSSDNTILMETINAAFDNGETEAF